MLARFAAVLVCLVTQAFAESTSLVGSWYADDSRTYYEMHFRSNHTFALFARMSTRNPELAVAQMGEQFGTWRRAGDRVVLDSTEASANRQSHVSLRFRLSGDSLRVQRFYDTSRSDTYRRLNLPVCANSHSAARDLNKRALVGGWRGHYRTHDTEFAFQPNGRVDVYSRDRGSRRKFLEATWRLRKNVVIMNTHQGGGRITWRILRVGRHCMVVSDGSEMSYALQRIE